MDSTEQRLLSQDVVIKKEGDLDTKTPDIVDKKNVDDVYLPTYKQYPALNFSPIESPVRESQAGDQQVLLFKDKLENERTKAKAIAKKKQAELNDLIVENRRLADQVSTLSNQVNIQTSYVLDSQEREKKLNQELTLARSHHASLLNSPINRIKTSIEQQPDLLKSNVNVKTDVSDKQSINDNVFVDIELEAKQIETEVVDSNEPPTADIDRFTGAVEFGFKYEQDNQVTKNTLGRLILDYDEVDKYNINSDLDFEFETENSKKSKDKFRWQLQGDYNLDPTNLIFVRSDIQRSQFASYEQEDTFTVGYGRIFFNENNHKLNTEIGPGYKFAVPNIEEEAVSVDEFILRTRLNYERIISENLQVSLEGVIELGDQNSVFTSEFRVQNRIYQELYLIFDINYKYNQNVPVETVHREVSTGFNLMYAF